MISVRLVFGGVAFFEDFLPLSDLFFLGQRHSSRTICETKTLFSHVTPGSHSRRVGGKRQMKSSKENSLSEISKSKPAVNLEIIPNEVRRNLYWETMWLLIFLNLLHENELGTDTHI